MVFCALVLGSLSLGTFSGCANRGSGPQGGPKDSIPPLPVKSIPENGAVNFHGDRIEILFNEYLQLDNVSKNLLMSPPQQTPPEVKARGKRVLIRFEDSLQTDATYTLDFGAAICDYTEKNPIRGYAFAFSTGPEIDTLELFGRVINAEDLNPVTDILAGIHRIHHDSAFTSMPFTRIARTDSVGAFRIGNIHPGQYRLYAVDDFSRDYRLTVGEGLAYSDCLYAPPAENALLWFFQETKSRLYMQRLLRDKQHMVQLFFSTSPDSLPVLRPLSPSALDTTRSDSGWVDPSPYMLMVPSAHFDTVTLWLTDSLAISLDTITLEARYRRSDSLYNFEWYTDTLRAVWRAPKLNDRAKAAQDRQNRNRKLELKSNARKGFELYDTLSVTCSTPLRDIYADSLHLYERKDTVYKRVPFQMLTSDMRVQIVAKLEQGKSYELQVDSAAMTDVYGIANHAQKFSLQMKTPEDYSTLRVRVIPYNAHIRVQLLNNKDKVLREQPAKTDGAFFKHLKPDSYYLRLYIDTNGDGQWTTGSWEDHRQPEPVYYYPGKIQTKANWDFEEEWDYTAKPQLESKPRELINVGAKKK